MLGLRGSVNADAGLFKRAAQEIVDLLRKDGVAEMPLGVDIVEPPMLFALQEEGLDVQGCSTGDAERSTNQEHG